MKVHEYLAQYGQESLQGYCAIVGMAAQTTKTLRDMEEPELAEAHLDMVQYITKMLTDEAKIRQEESATLLDCLTQKPVTIFKLAKDHPHLLDPKIKFAKRKLAREMARLVAEGKAIRVSTRTFALPPPQDPTPETLN